MIWLQKRVVVRHAILEWSVRLHFLVQVGFVNVLLFSIGQDQRVLQVSLIEVCVNKLLFQIKGKCINTFRLILKERKLVKR